MRVILSLLFVLTASQSVSAECGNLCVWWWWNDASTEMVSEEIAKGSDINGRNFYDGDTPLHEASMYGSRDTIGVLLDANADINAINQKGLTPFLSASRYGPPENKKQRLEELIKRGSNIHYETKQGENALLLVALASGYQNPPPHEAIKLLLDNDISVKQPGKSGVTTLHLLAKFAPKETFTLLSDTDIGLFIRDNQDNTPLHYASEGSFTDNVVKLIQIGAPINFANKDGLSALHLAAKFNRLDTVKNLIAMGADIGAIDKDGATPLQISMQSSAKEKNGVLMHAGSFSKEDRLEIVKLLLESGADPNFKDSKGNTALHYAAKYSEPEDVEQLLSFGAHIRASNLKNEIPFELANGNSRIRSQKVYWKLQPN